MDRKSQDNPLLLLSNDLPSSTLILPPAAPPQQIDESADVTPESKPSSSLMQDTLAQVLQPHLEKTELVSSNEPSLPKPPVVPSMPLIPPQTAQAVGPPSAALGNSFLRKPTGKYVVPPEIGNTTNVPPIFPSNSPSFTPSPPETFDPSTAGMQGNVSQMYLPSGLPASFEAMALNPPVIGPLYQPVIPHWFYSEGKGSVWKPFSLNDSLNLEKSYQEGSKDLIATDGGRFDVSIEERKRIPIYWEADPGYVRRCTWFRRSYAELLPLPYEESIAEKLEAEYKDSMLTGRWHRQVELPGGEIIMMNSPVSIHHYHIMEPTEFPNTVSISDAQQTPQVVKRGAEDFNIEKGPPERVDHLIFIVHGIGSVCDLSFRSLNECVDDFRKIGDELLVNHFKESVDSGQIGRIEILPIAWHKALHGEPTGLDKKLKVITLRSIPKFRDFINDTLLDILFYTSPVYCQHIMDTVASEMDKLYQIFLKRNPTFAGGVSLSGHSLGAVILFDLLVHQNPKSSIEDSAKEDGEEEEEREATPPPPSKDNYSHRPSLNFEMGSAGTGQPAIVYPQLPFKPQALFLLGSPVGMFFTVRGIDKLSRDFILPTCDRVFNIFHPFDPVAYRLETLIDDSLIDLRPVLIPHHKGRKRMHLELKDTLERVGADIKNRIMESIQSTWNKVYQMYSGANQDNEDDLYGLQEDQESRELSDSNIQIGKLNRGERIDFVLQEKPYESITEYIFALQAHLAYWKSEDTVLMILRELFRIQNVFPDVKKKVSSVESPQFNASAVQHVSHQQPLTQQPTPTPLYYNNVLNNPQEPPPMTTPVPMMTSPPQQLPPMAAPVPMMTSPPLQPPPMAAPVPMMTSPPQETASIAGPIPMLSPQDGSFLPPVSKDFNRQLRSLSGRPVMDPCNLQPIGMDPTVSPVSDKPIAPPPIVSNVSFSRKKIG